MFFGRLQVFILNDTTKWYKILIHGGVIRPPDMRTETRVELCGWSGVLGDGGQGARGGHRAQMRYKMRPD